MTVDDWEPDWTEIYGALANSQRRSVVRYVGTTSDPVTVFDIATHLLLDAGEALSEERLDALQIGLSHLHIPKLLSADLVEWNGNTVEATPLLAHIPLETLYPTPQNAVDSGPATDPGPDERSGLI